MANRLTALSAAALTLLTGGVLAADAASTATLTVASGPHAGKYTLSSDKACTIGPLDKGRPDSFSATIISEGMRQGKLASRPNELGTVQIDLPNIDAKHLGEIKVEVAFGDPTARERKGTTPGVLYAIDTRPDSALLEFEREVRGTSKLKGKGGAKLQRRGADATFGFWGETANGIRLDGSIECRGVKHDRSYY